MLYLIILLLFIKQDVLVIDEYASPHYLYLTETIGQQHSICDLRTYTYEECIIKGEEYKVVIFPFLLTKHRQSLLDTLKNTTANVVVPGGYEKCVLEEYRPYVTIVSAKIGDICHEDADVLYDGCPDPNTCRYCVCSNSLAAAKYATD